MPTFLLCHRHEPAECRTAFAAWRGTDSPLRGRATLGSCVSGDHEIWWQVSAPHAAAALAQLPEFVAIRTRVVEVRETAIP